MLGDQASCLYTYFLCFFHFLNNFLKKKVFKEIFFLAVQWLELWTFTAGDWLRSLVRKLRSSKQCGAAKKKKKKFSSHLEHIIPISPVLVPVTAVNYTLEKDFKIKEGKNGGPESCQGRI